MDAHSVSIDQRTHATRGSQAWHTDDQQDSVRRLASSFCSSRPLLPRGLLHSIEPNGLRYLILGFSAESGLSKLISVTLK